MELHDDDFCLGPPCKHFPKEVRTVADALEYLSYRALSLETAMNYVKNVKIHGVRHPVLDQRTDR